MGGTPLFGRLIGFCCLGSVLAYMCIVISLDLCLSTLSLCCSLALAMRASLPYASAWGSRLRTYRSAAMKPYVPAISLPNTSHAWA